MTNAWGATLAAAQAAAAGPAGPGRRESRPSAEEGRASLSITPVVRVLVVDDQASTRRYLRGVLDGSPRFEVVGEANDGLRAQELALELQPDVVLLDVGMPRMDGATALAGLRHVAPQARIVVLSGVDAEVAQHLLDAGATAFLPKGGSPLELLERLTAVSGPPPPVLVRVPRAVVCDDDPMARRLAGEVLGRCEVDVVAETSTVPNLLSVVGMIRPELVVLDLWLEGTPGTVAPPEIRALSPGTDIVVFSAFTEWEHRALAEGVAAFVAKPHMDQLEVQVRRLVDARRR